jgi:F-type H+-transporting ATPase subunit a
MATPHISLAAEKIFEIGNIFSITNSLLTTWIVMSVIITLVFLGTRRMQLIPGNLQSILEFVVESLFNLFKTALHEKTGRYFTLLASLFIFIIISNWIGLLPGVGTVGIFLLREGHEKFVPLFRSASADLNTTLSLALIVMCVVQFSGIKTLGTKYFSKFINLKNPIYFYVGILELISEFAKIVSFAFRLFGNIFAGEVLLTVIAFLIPVFAPLPFLGLELFVGFIQALVFSMLSAVFIAQATTQEQH